MGQEPCVIVIFGASGDLACKKILPSLWGLYKLGQLEGEQRIVGFARSKHTVVSLAATFRPHCKVRPEEETIFGEFCARLHYCEGSYEEKSFVELERILRSFEAGRSVTRIFYFALPPAVYTKVAQLARAHCSNDDCLTRLVVEKPFGYDLVSAVELNTSLLQLYPEQQIYRIDHYLGKEMVQSILTLRLANLITSAIWSRHHIRCVVLNFKEDVGTFGRGNYYDDSGVIRDIIQNHSMQVLSLLAMEPPKSLLHDDIKGAKSQVLKEFRPILLENVVLGQYVGDPNSSDEISERRKGYKDDHLVPDNSLTPTFATIVAYIDNERWQGVPFIFKAGKALNERKAEIRVQFHPVQNSLFHMDTPNELVLRLQPDEAIYLKILTKLPGFGEKLTVTELNLDLKERHRECQPPEAYEKLLLDVIRGSHVHFVRSDEVEGSWRIFSPLLDQLKQQKVVPLPYTFGSRGPAEADELMQRAGFIYDPRYKWAK